MNKKRYIDILIGLTFLGLIGTYLFDHYINPQKTNISPHPKLIKANDILRRKSRIPDSSLNITVTSSACTLFLKNSAELSMNDYANEFIDHNIDGIIKTCSGAFPTPLQNHIDNAIAKCKTSSRNKISKECYAALIETKTSSVANIIKADVKLEELDPSLLLHLIADKFVTGDFLEYPSRSLEIIDALLDKEPSYLGGYKTKLFLLSMSSLNKDEYYKEMFQDTLDEAKRLSPNDPDLREIALAEKGNIFKQSNDETPVDKKKNLEFIEYLEQESIKHPKDWIYDYYQANAIYDGGKGDYNQTVALLEKALKKDPNESRLKQTLENLKSTDEVKRHHPFIITLGFSLDDL